MAFWLLKKKKTQIPAKPGLNGSKDSYAPVNQMQLYKRKTSKAGSLLGDHLSTSGSQINSGL